MTLARQLHFRAFTTALLLGPLLSAVALAQSAPPGSMGIVIDYPQEDAELIADLVTANHILAHYGHLDGFGHISVRSKSNPNIYYMSRRSAPALVETAGILALDLDSVPIDPAIRAIGRDVPRDAPPSLAAMGGKFLSGERPIHGAIYRVRPDVNAVVHYHPLSLIAFGISKTPFVPVFHMAGFLRQSTPIFDISDEQDTGAMLVLSNRLGAAVAKSLGPSPMVLMRNHGATVVGSTVKEAVFRAMYAVDNAIVEMQAIALGGGVKGLTPQEIKYNPSEIADPERPWQLWKSEAEGKR